MNHIIEAEAIELHQIDPNRLRNARRFEEAVKAIAQELRQCFNLADLSHLRFEVKVQGRVHGDLKVSFSMSDASWGGDVEGHSIQPILLELFRRHGWNKRHTPQALGYNGEDKEDDIAF